MTIATALLFTVLSAGTDHDLLPSAAHIPMPGGDRQQATSGIIIAADIEGRVAIYDREHRLVVQLDKPAGRQLQVALEPGVYEVQLLRTMPRRLRIQIGEGQQLLVDESGFPDPEPPPTNATADPHAHRAQPPPQHPRDGRHRIEVRFGGWGTGSHSAYSASEAWGWGYGGSAQVAFGFEYLNFVRNDLGVGIGLTTLARGNGDWDSWDDEGSGQATCSIPVVARWYPIRRLTRTRAVEPYVTAGIGPVFGVNAVWHDYDPHQWYGDHVSSAHVGTTIGGRIGGGMDVRLGSVFTIGMAGAWNWDAGFDASTWQVAPPGGGEFTVTFGWNFGG